MRNLYLNRAIAEAVRLEMEQDPQIVLLASKGSVNTASSCWVKIRSIKAAA